MRPTLRPETVFRCPICKLVHETEEQAQDCIDSDEPMPTDVKAGDFVSIPGVAYGWFDGDSAWIHRQTKDRRTHSGKSIEFFFLVTAVRRIGSFLGRPRHEWCIDVVTKGIKAPYKRGWTRAEGHHSYKRIPPAKVPPALLAEADSLLITCQNTGEYLL